MGSQAKKRHDLSDSEEESESEEMEISDEEISETDIQADFEFFDPAEEDSDALYELLSKQLHGVNTDISDLTKSIIQQRTVGSVLKCGEGEDSALFGVISVFNFKQHEDSKWIQSIKHFILSNCQNDDKKKIFQQAMDSAKTGLIINERVINCPPQIGPPLNQALFEEIGWAQEDEPTQELKDYFKLDQYIIITKIYQDLNTEQDDSNQPSKKSKVKGPTGYIYAKPEDEFYHKFSKEWFTFPLNSEQDAELHSFRLILLLSQENVNQARMTLDAIVGNPARPSL